MPSNRRFITLLFNVCSVNNILHSIRYQHLKLLQKKIIFVKYINKILHKRNINQINFNAISIFKGENQSFCRAFPDLEEARYL